jgi:hypothetical protein
VTSNQLLEIAQEDMPTAKPFVHLLGRTQTKPVVAKDTYQVMLQVKPYLTKQQCGPMNITLIHHSTDV